MTHLSYLLTARNRNTRLDVKTHEDLIQGAASDHLRDRQRTASCRPSASLANLLGSAVRYQHTEIAVAVNARCGGTKRSEAIAYAAVRSGLRVLYAEADQLLINLVQASPLTKRRLFKPVIDADLLVLDDLLRVPDASPWKALTNCNPSCTDATNYGAAISLPPIASSPTGTSTSATLH